MSSLKEICLANRFDNNLLIKPRCYINVFGNMESTPGCIVTYEVFSIKFRPNKQFNYELIVRHIQDTKRAKMYINNNGEVKNSTATITSAFNYLPSKISKKVLTKCNYGEF